MTAFIESFATHQLLPPWQSAGAITWAFVVRLDADRIRHYLDRYFNGAYPDQAPYVYTPLPQAHYGVLTAVFHPLMWTKSVRNGPWDTVTVTEVYLGIPVHRRPVSADNIILDEATVVWVQPFLFGDNASVVFGSREIWGTDMDYASILRDEPGPGELHLDVAVEAIKTFSPRSVSQLIACLHLTTEGYSELTIDQVRAQSPDLTELLDILAATGVFSFDEPPPPNDPHAVCGELELNHLKQFRDVHNMGAAIYRGIVATRTTHVNVEQFHVFDCDKVQIDFMWSDSLAEMLEGLFGFTAPTAQGPPPDHAHAGTAPPAPEMPLKPDPEDIEWSLGRCTLKAEFAFRVRTDIAFEVVRTLHTYGV